MSPIWHPTFDLGDPFQVALSGRGTTTVWDSGDVADSTNVPVLLLHGWNIDAPTNYGYAVPHLSSTRRVIMFDQLGHGRGPRHDVPFTLDDAADDAISVLDALGVEQAIIVGYSLGGAVAQTLCHNHPTRCVGLVLSATSARFAETRRERAEFAALKQSARLLRLTPSAARARIFDAILAVTTRKYPGWIADVVRKGDPISLLEAGAALGAFDSTHWTELAELPTAFVVTTEDTVVPAHRQVQLATNLDVDDMHNVTVGHEAPILNHDAFNAALTEAVDAVTGLQPAR